MKKKSNFKLVLVAVSGAVLVSSFFLLKNRNPRQTELSESSIIMTAKDRMPEGSSVDKTNIEWKEATAGQITPDTITKAQKDVIHDVEGAVVKSPIEKGGLIKLNNLIKTGGKSALSTVIKQGMRAVPVPFAKIANPPALISPGDVVDIILPKKSKEKGSDDSYIGQTILKGLRVLAVDTALQKSEVETNVGGAKNATRTMTLEVSADQAEALGASIRDGQIILSVQSIFTKEEDNTVKKTSAEVKTEIHEPANRTIKITRGTETKDITVRN